MKKIASVTTGMLIMLLSVTAQAQILKCVGKDGKIEFSTACPAGTKQQDTGVANKPVAAPAAKAADKGDKGAKPQSLADRDAEFRKRQSEQKDAAAKSEQQTIEAQDKQRACEVAQANLVALKSRQRLSRTDPKTGERTTYEEADYLRDIPLMERQIAQNCKS